MIVENLQTTTDANQIDIIFGIILFVGVKVCGLLKFFGFIGMELCGYLDCCNTCIVQVCKMIDYFVKTWNPHEQ